MTANVGLRCGKLLEQVGHAAFEMQAVVENHVGARELLDIGRHGFVEMRIDARAHQRGDLHVLAADVLEHVGDRAGRADDLDRILAGERAVRDLGRLGVIGWTHRAGNRKWADNAQSKHQQDDEGLSVTY